MSQKRQTEDGDCFDDKRRRTPSFQSVVHRVVWMETVRNLLEPILEPLIHKVVKEEVDLALKKYMISVNRNWEKDMHGPAIKSLRLQFLSALSLPVFTGARIDREDLFPVKIALVDASTGQMVGDGPESLAKIEIVVLEGDFDSDYTENWTVEEFKSNIVREREGKKALLTGETIFNLVDGSSSLGDIAFTDNSSWTRSHRFRLGARLVDTFEGIRVKEAKTESFVVRDHHGEFYCFHCHWKIVCLTNFKCIKNTTLPVCMMKYGDWKRSGKMELFHKRLSRDGVKTVKDFLTLFHMNPLRLRNVTAAVVFNIVGQVMGSLSESQHMPIDKLSEAEKVDAQNLVISAFQHWENVVSYDREACLTAGSSHLSNPSSISRSPRTEQIDVFDYTQSTPFSADIVPSMYPTGELGCLEDYALDGLDNLGLKYEQTVNLPSQVANALICDVRPMNHDFFDEDHLRFFSPDRTLQPEALKFGTTRNVQCSNNGWRRSAIAVAQMRWTKVFSVFKWFWTISGSLVPIALFNLRP